jgi:GNAT superfamily N-acetyltransferase
MTRKIKTTITHLEMLSDPKLRTPLPRGKFSLIRAMNTPVHFYRYLYDTVGRDYWWVSRRILSDEALLKIIHHEQVHIYILYIEGVPAGFAELDLRKFPVADLAFLGVMPDFIGQGLGRFLLCETIETAWMHHPKKMTVQTCTLDHPRALSLYQRNGFSPYGQEEVELIDPDG